MKKILVLISSVILIFITGCAVVPLGLSYSSTPLDNSNGKHKQYQILGKSEGSQGYFSLFGIIPFGSPDFSEAITDAAQQLNGDALINVRYWSRSSFYLIGTYTSIEVMGDVIKFKQQKEN